MDELKNHFAALATRGNSIPGVVYRGRARSWVLALVADDLHAWLRNDSGRYEVTFNTPTAEPDLRLTGEIADWLQLFSEDPKPGCQTLAAMLLTDRLRLEGETLLFNQYNLALELIFGALASVEPPAAAARDAFIEPVTGHYLNLVHEARAHRIYFEEAGSGIPLVCLHTAGADGRQYRGLLNDPAVTANFRVIVFDLPRHGKSSLMPGFGGDAYFLTTKSYVGIVMAVVGALKLEAPVVMGCSIGGRAVLHLAMTHGKTFRAAIGLQSALAAQTHMDMSGESALDIFRPDVNGGEFSAAAVAGIMARNSDPIEKWETLWYYMQGGPGVFMGDLYYYFQDGDLRNRIAGGIDTQQCPLYLLTGEYDLSATRELTAELAQEVGATHFEIMPGLGHFPMSENYQLFRDYLLPVLNKIRDI
jgi:pimeloyl-ACP methyl ester carboxylesterase